MPCPTALDLLQMSAEDGLHTGAQLCVSLSGEVIVNEAMGELSPGVPMTQDVLMLWLSAGKPIAAVAAAQLHERGFLDFDAPVAGYLPAFAAGGKEAITVRHLLTHTAGIRPSPFNYPYSSWEQIIAKICAMRLERNWVPGEKAGYHVHSSWFILGELIHTIDGRPYPDYVREEIFEPLGMMNTWAGMPPEAFHEAVESDRLGIAYNTAPDALQPYQFHTEPWVTGCRPGGNTYGPAAELARFYECLLRGGALDGKQILQPQTVDLLIERHREGMFDETFKHMMDWGLGFILNTPLHDPAEPVMLPYGFGRHASESAFGHGGMQSVNAFADPEYDLVITLIHNGLPGEAAHHARSQPVITAVYEDLGLV